MDNLGLYYNPRAIGTMESQGLTGVPGAHRSPRGSQELPLQHCAQGGPLQGTAACQTTFTGGRKTQQMVQLSGPVT